MNKLLNMLKEPIIIDSFNEGFSNYNGKFERTVNVDIDTIIGSLLVNTRPIDIKVANVESLTGHTFTVDTSEDTLISTGFGDKIFTGQAITVSTTGTLPAGLSVDTVYYVIYVDSDTIKLSTSLYNVDNSIVVDITDSGSGTHTIAGIEMKDIIKFIQNPNALGSDYRFYAIDSTGQVWVSYDEYFTKIGGNTSGNVYGAEIYANYLFIFRDSAIDVYGSLDNVGNTATWTNSWKTIESDSKYHPSLVGQDDVMYIGTNNLIASIEKIGTFDPSDSGTYSFNDSALDLPENYRVKTLAELGKYLAIGTWQGANIFDFKVADLFLWDRVSPTFELPVKIQENGINAMISINNLLYIVAGYNGNIYVSDGTSCELFVKLPKTFFHTTKLYSLYFEPNAIMHHQGKLFIGVGSFTTGNSQLYPLGVISIDLKTGKMTMENTLSTGNDGNGNYVRIGAMISVSDYYYYYSWTDNSQTYKYGIDYNYNNRKLYKDYQAYVETGFLQIGNNYKKETLKKFEIVLNKKLRPNQVVRLSYRTSSDAEYTEIGTMSYQNDGVVNSKVIDNATVEVELAQFKIDFDFSDSETNSTELRNIIIQ